MARAMILVLGAVLAAGCAAAPRRSMTPLPPALAVVPPAADIPPEIARFSGTWVGQWKSWTVTMEHTLVIEAIERRGDTYRARVVYSHGEQPVWGYTEAAIVRTDGTIGRDARLRLKAFPDGARVLYTLSSDQELAGELNLGGFTAYGAFVHPTP